MNFSEHIQMYCERTHDHLFAEPLNLLSNAAFLVAGIAIFLRARRSHSPTYARILSVLVCLIGFGSAAFHAFASLGTLILDVFAIALSTLFVFYMYLGLILKVALIKKVVLFTFLIGLSAGLPVVIPSELTNGSSEYLGILVMLFLFSRWDPSASGQRHMLVATGIFGIALLVRSFDLAICHLSPYGIHFIWHLCSAYLLFYLAKRFEKA